MKMQLPRRSPLVLTVVGLAVALTATGCATVVGNGPSFKFYFGVSDPADEWDTKAVQKWASDVEDDTGGHVQISVIPNDALGANSTQLVATQKGSQFGYAVSEGDLEGLDPLFTLPDLPYMFPKGTKQAEQIMNGPFGSQLNDALLRHGLRSAGWITFGPRDIISKKPVVSPADLKGLRLRVQPSRTMKSGYQKLGADINPIAYSQVYTALATGTVEAMENAPTQLYAGKMYELAKHLALNDTIYTVGAMLISQKLFAKLPPKYRSIVLRDGKAAGADEFSTFEKANDEAIDQMKAHGTHVHTVDTSEWERAVGDTAEEFAKKEGPRVYSAYREIRRAEAASH